MRGGMAGLLQPLHSFPNKEPVTLHDCILVQIESHVNCNSIVQRWSLL